MASSFSINNENGDGDRDRTYSLPTLFSLLLPLSLCPLSYQKVQRVCPVRPSRELPTDHHQRRMHSNKVGSKHVPGR